MTEESCIPVVKDIKSTGEVVSVQEEGVVKGQVFECRGIITGSKFFAVAHRDLKLGEHLWRPYEPEEEGA